jgi:hypothetical protein
MSDSRRRAIRKQRLKEYHEISTTGALGLLSIGLTMWLLDVSRERVRVLILEGKLKTTVLAGQRLVLFSSVYRWGFGGCDNQSG